MLALHALDPRDPKPFWPRCVGVLGFAVRRQGRCQEDPIGRPAGMSQASSLRFCLASGGRGQSFEGKTLKPEVMGWSSQRLPYETLRLLTEQLEAGVKKRLWLLPKVPKSAHSKNPRNHPKTLQNPSRLRKPEPPGLLKPKAHTPSDPLKIPIGFRV